MPFADPESARPQRHTMVLLGIVASFAAVTALRFAVDDPNQAIGFLYGVPISLAAARFGWPGAIVSGGLAVTLAVGWALAEAVPFETVAARLAVFAVVGFVIGLQAQKSIRLEAERERLLKELQRVALLDQLTGVANRRSWDERFAVELRQAGRAGHELTLVAVDLDGLKQVNDTHGHEGGDRLIRAATASLADGIRETDFLARVGGDEFLILLPRCSSGDAARLIERVLAAVPAEQGFTAGVAAWDGHGGGNALIERADRALYRAKAAGGGTVARAESATVSA